MTGKMTSGFVERAKRGELAWILPGALPSESALKRAVDVFLCVLALPVALPLIGLIALLVKCSDGGPAIFMHTRCGVHGGRFACLKFRTMVVDAEERLKAHLKADPRAAEDWARDHKLRNDPRITKIGAFLRRTSLDELPQIFNILRGDMSIVGPRPIVEAEIEKYGDDFVYYSATRPGLTGSWQVNGRSETSYEERVRMDVDYVRTWSLWSDVKIIAATIPAVLLRKGAV